MKRASSCSVLIVLITASAVLGACSSGASAPTAAASKVPSQHGYFVYWDENEELDFLATQPPRQAHLIPPWDPNGQMCLMNDGTGRFSVGYNPTVPSQHNPGGLKPYKQPPIGQAIYDRTGHFTGRTAFVPGPYHLQGQTLGGDIPPEPSGNFNGNGTYTGCTFDTRDNLLATDIGTAQGSFPTPSDGRLIEWFAPSYTTYCILDGPTQGGVGPHHVDGSGGLRQPGMLAITPAGDLLLAEAGADQSGLPAGRVLLFDHSSFPKSASQCGPVGLYSASKLHYSVFIQGSLSFLPFPQGIALDPVCGCWAVSTIIGNPGVAWFDYGGHQLTNHGVVPGESLSQIGERGGYNPFGLAFGPDGVLYFTDISIVCENGSLSKCGPAPNGGREMKVTITNRQPSTPTPFVTGLNFPTSVTVCVPGPRVCPEPR